MGYRTRHKIKLSDSMKHRLSYSITFDILADEELNSSLNAFQELFNFLFSNAEIKKGKYFSNHIKIFWPYLLHIEIDQLDNSEFEVILLPLNRVGAVEGASGSRVFVTYFSLVHKEFTRYSNPMLFKFYKHDIEGDKLEDERGNAESVESFTNQHFAVPMFYSKDKFYSFLWAPFTSNIYPFSKGVGKGRPILKEENLWKLIRKAFRSQNKADISLVNKILRETYDIFHFWHINNDNPLTINRTYLEEYKWYLRNHSDWSNVWLNCWGSSETKDLMEFNRQWINPFWILDKVLEKKQDFSCGAIHGDLHPRNIVIAQDDTPMIIDFGWTQKSAHFVKDFALMEANFRFIQLPSDRSYDFVDQLSKSIEYDSISSKVEDDCVYSWLTTIRNSLNRICDKDDFKSQYIIPLFIISIGMLKLSHQFTNQISMRLTILELAKYIYDNELYI